MSAPTQLSEPGFVAPSDNSEGALKKAFVFIWSFVHKIVMQVNSTIQVANAAAVQVSVPDTSWHEIGAAGEPAFQNGWVNVGSGNNTVAFRKDAFGFVHFKGSITGVTANTVAFVLPAGYRPVATAGVPVSAGTSATTASFVTIYSAGNVTPSNPNAQSWDGVTFYAGP